MLHSREVIEIVAENCALVDLPLVVDPVMVSTSGDSLLQADAVQVYGQILFPHAIVVTPNLDEASVLLGGRNIVNVAAMRMAGNELTGRHGTAFLMKGGHLGGDTAIDLLCLPDGEVIEYRTKFTRGLSTHGTGCTYSAAITAGLAQGLALPDAVAQAKPLHLVRGCAVVPLVAWRKHDRCAKSLAHALCRLKWHPPSSLLLLVFHELAHHRRRRPRTRSRLEAFAIAARPENLLRTG